MKGTHASIQDRSSHVTAAMVTVSRARTQAATLEERIIKEEVVLTEKKEACLKLLTQVGQDTAILEQHSRLLTKQRERISHLRKVRSIRNRIVRLQLENVDIDIVSFYTYVSARCKP